MIQDIYPHVYHNEYRDLPPADDSFVIAARNQKILCRFAEDAGPVLELPTVSEAETIWTVERSELRFLFCIDEMPFYLLNREVEEKDGYQWQGVLSVRGIEPAYLSFAIATASHLAGWYESNRFCGRCGTPTMHSSSQRALKCPSCGQIIFPRISPIIITAVTDGDRMLVAKNNRKHFNPGNTNYVLLAGYVEIGESYEDTVRREIREETGLELKRIRYAASQPWPFSSTSIAGFYAEADSTQPLKIQKDELSELVWMKREDLPPRKTRTSVTDNLIEWFRSGLTVEEIRAMRE